MPDFSTVGTWADETDLCPTMLFATGLTDDYVMDGRVITELFNGNGQLKQTNDVGACYKQLNAAVGRFGTDALLASSAALASGSATDDSTYVAIDSQLATMGAARDALATDIKNGLDQVEFHGASPNHGAIANQLAGCNALLAQAHALATSST